MLTILTSSEDKQSAQRRLMRALHTSLPAKVKHKIGFPGPGKTREHAIRSIGFDSLYYAYSKPDYDDPIPRHWNTFGILRSDRSVQHIVVEINIPADRNDGRVSGFFARDPASGAVYLMHDGGIGGGRKGVGKEGFLADLSWDLEQVITGKTTRKGLRIADLDDPNIAGLIWQFVLQVDAFKRAATSRPELGGDQATDKRGNGPKKYFDEFWGSKRGGRAALFDYTSYHGLIVRALREEREATLSLGQQIGKDTFIDLYVWQDGKFAEIYEVKTKAERQSFYTAVGQLMTHGWQSGASRFLVVPEGNEFAPDCQAVLDHLGILIRRFAIVGTGVRAKVTLKT